MNENETTGMEFMQHAISHTNFIISEIFKLFVIFYTKPSCGWNPKMKPYLLLELNK